MIHRFAQVFVNNTFQFPACANTANQEARASFFQEGGNVWWLRMSRWVWAAKSSDACQPVNLYSVNHRLTRTWFVPLSLARTWFVPLSACDHSQGVSLPQHRRWSIVFRVLFQQTNKQKKENKQTIQCWKCSQTSFFWSYKKGCVIDPRRLCNTGSFRDIETT